MIINYPSRANYINTFGNVLAPLISTNVPLYNSNEANQYINPDQYVQQFSDPTGAFPIHKHTILTIGAPIRPSYGAIYQPWRNQPFAFVFDWFPGLVMVNNWPIEIIMHFSLYNQLHQNEGILPFCLNKPGLDRIDWDSCKDYSHSNISAWQINKTTNKYPTKWLGIYFKENLGVNHNYNGQEKFEYWLNQWHNGGLIPKICVFGVFDSTGTAEFNAGSATDDIKLTIVNEDIPKTIENVHIDVYNAGVNCGSIRKDWQITVTEEVTIQSTGPTIAPIPTGSTGSLPEVSWPTGAVLITAIPEPTAITMTTTIHYPTGVLPLPNPGQKIIKIDPNSGASWVSYDGGITWYVEDPYSHQMNGPFSEPYWGMYNLATPPAGSPYWLNPWADTAINGSYPTV